MNDLETALQIGACIKEEISDLYNRLAELALVFTDAGDPGALASQMVTSTQTITTWADVFATFGTDAIKPTDPLNPAWWRAILKTDNPRHWLEQARDRQLGAAQIRAEAGVKQERKPPWYNGGGTLEGRPSGNLLFSPDMEIKLKGRMRAQVRIKEVEK